MGTGVSRDADGVVESVHLAGQGTAVLRKTLQGKRSREAPRIEYLRDIRPLSETG